MLYTSNEQLNYLLKFKDAVFSEYFSEQYGYFFEKLITNYNMTLDLQYSENVDTTIEVLLSTQTPEMFWLYFDTIDCETLFQLFFRFWYMYAYLTECDNVMPLNASSHVTLYKYMFLHGWRFGVSYITPTKLCELFKNNPLD